MNSRAAVSFPQAMASGAKADETADFTKGNSLGLLDQTKSPRVIPLFELSDELLLEQIQQGNMEALGIFFRRYARGVRIVADRILRNEAEADDLVQEVFLFIFRKAPLFDAGQGGARSWIFYLTYHRAFDRLRYLNSRHFYTSRDLETVGDDLADPSKNLPFYESSLEGVLGKELTAKFNARLTREQQEIIRLFFFDGYALKEIAELTGHSLVNVRSYYYRGLDRLRKFIFPETRSQGRQNKAQ